MKCPNCSSLEKSRVRVCPECGTAYASQDLLELRQLEYLLGETAAWPEVEALRQPYAEQMESLRSRLLGPKTTQPSVAEAPQLVVETPLVQPTLPAPPPAPPPPLPPPAVTVEKPKKEALPFDQWLLSERNIKFALYSGGLLLVIAGLIFVGVNWRWLSGPIKFVITTSITGLMYLGGVLLFRRPFLRMGGVALLAVACGFFPLNFAVLQIYVAGARGLEDNLMWLIGSLSALLLYFLTSYWTRADLFTYFSLAALTSAATASMVLLDLFPTAYPLVFALLALACLLVARGLRSTAAADFAYLPLLITSQLAVPVLFASAFLLWAASLSDARLGSPWLALAAMGVCALFYLATDLAFGWIITRWATAGAFGFTSILILIELNLSPTMSGMVLMTLALAYLLVGYSLQRKSERIKAGLPLYAAGYALAALITLQAMAVFSKQPILLAQALLFDVLLLVVSARLHRQYGWVYGAVWLFLMPAAIYADVYLRSNSGIGIVLGVLLLIYAAAGYWLGRRAINTGLPFLSAAAFLSLVIVPLVWAVPALASLVLGTLAALYLLFAIWLRASWLLLPALTAAHLLAISIFDINFTPASPWQHSLTLVYAVSGVALSLGCYWLQRQDKLGWVWPLLAFALLDLAATFLSGLVLGGWMAIGLSAAYATLAFWLAWAEREMRIVSKLALMFSYLGVALVFIGHFYLIAFTELARIYWPSYTAGLCALFIALTWLARRGERERIYGAPLHYSGVALMLAPLLGAVVVSSPGLWISFTSPGSVIVTANAALPVITYAIAGAIFLIDAVIRRSWLMGYMGGGAFAVVIWYALAPRAQALTIAYAVLGVALVLGGYWLRRRDKMRWAWPLLAFALLDLAATYLSALVLGGWMAIGLSAVYAVLAFWLAWAEKRVSDGSKLAPVFTYLGVGLVFIGHYYVLAIVKIAWIVWSPYTAGLCALLVALSWLMRRGEPGRIYGVPLHRSGLFLMFVPMLGAVVMSSRWLWMSFSSPGDVFVITTAIPPMITYAIAAVIFTADAAMRRNWLIGYLGSGAFVVLIWYSLSYLGVEEWQAYIIPAGLGLLLLGWNEQRLARRGVYRLVTLIGLSVLMVSAFYQSLFDTWYAALLLVECLFALGWGIRTRSRIYVQAGVAALLVVAVAQLGPAFIELPRWVEVGIIGSLLLGGGLFALFRREQIVTARKNLSTEWKKWQP